ncbi:uncharacterized PE-PGRS family protein PE_PGRS54-like [Zingiber officinale]|uniref:uncharacterized PE-PGRS family protein PE_PGRS54-like n=1 Tax=Zingiber officinale TaxID=94328 RepID=UPI001C4D5CD2|nr:uncharacterized PE-PGRS family protein PE_PGRS54-like [Zingiber officinale]
MLLHKLGHMPPVALQGAAGYTIGTGGTGAAGAGYTVGPGGGGIGYAVSSARAGVGYASGTPAGTTVSGSAEEIGNVLRKIGLPSEADQMPQEYPDLADFEQSAAVVNIGGRDWRSGGWYRMGATGTAGAGAAGYTVDTGGTSAAGPRYTVGPGGGGVGYAAGSAGAGVGYASGTPGGTLNTVGVGTAGATEVSTSKGAIGV